MFRKCIAPVKHKLTSLSMLYICICNKENEKQIFTGGRKQDKIQDFSQQSYNVLSERTQQTQLTTHNSEPIKIK